MSREQQTLADYAEETATDGGFVRASQLHDATDDRDDGESDETDEDGDHPVYGTCADCGVQEPGVWPRDPYVVELCKECYLEREGLA